jgi:hypothetical protein
MRASAVRFVRLDHFRSSPGAGQRQRVFGEWPSWPPAPQRARADSLFFGRHDRHLRGAGRGFSRERSRRRAACSSQASAGGQTERAKATVCCKEQSLIGVLGLALTVAEFGERRLAQKANLGCGWGERTGSSSARLILARGQTERREQHLAGESPEGELQKAREGFLIEGRRFGSLITVRSHALRRCGDLGRSRIVRRDAGSAWAVTETSEGKALEVLQGRQHPAWTENGKPPEAGDCGVNRIVHRPHQGKPWEAG